MSQAAEALTAQVSKLPPEERMEVVARMSIRLLEPAQSELEEAISWYAEQAPGLGDAFMIETLKTFLLIEQFPKAWHPLMPHIRRCRLRRFPYSVVYTQDGSDLLVLAVAHRNALLGRTSPPQELAFLAEPGSSF